MKLCERTRAHSLTMAALNLGVAGILFYPSWLAASSVLDGLTVVAVLPGVRPGALARKDAPKGSPGPQERPSREADPLLGRRGNRA